MKILLTSTSFQDAPGKHHDVLAQTGFQVNTLRGPVTEEVLLPIIANYDGVICSDDQYTRAVIKNGSKGRLRIISKYGVGLDSIDIEAAKEFGIAVTNCELVNHITVAEHVMALLLSHYKNIHLEHNYTRKGEWTRLIGHELYGKILGIAGLGKIGKEVAKRAIAFGMPVMAFDKYFDDEFMNKYQIGRCNTIEELVSQTDCLSLNLKLTPETEGIISSNLIFNKMKKGMIIINTARGKLVDLPALLEGLNTGIIGGYLTDVLEEEPMKPGHPLQDMKNVIITPHIGSRTYESVERQGIMAVNNLSDGLNVS